MDKDVFFGVIPVNEAISTFYIKPFYCAGDSFRQNDFFGFGLFLRLFFGVGQRTLSGHEIDHKRSDDRGSPQKRRRSDGNADDHSGKHRRLSKEGDDHKRRRRSDEGHRSRRRESDGHRSGRRDRDGHRSGRSDEKHVKKDVNKPEVKIDYEEEEGEVMNDDIVQEEKDGEKDKVEETNAAQNVEPVVKNVTMAENGEEGEEGEVKDEADE